MRKLPIVVAFLLLSASPLRAEDNPDPNAGVSGEHDFNMYCSSCHGVSAKGDGRIAARLEKKPPDLTLLTQRHGAFPAQKVAEVIDGRADVTAHGDREMPVWGRWFKEESAQELGGAAGDERTVKRRIDNVVNYIATLQVK